MGALRAFSRTIQLYFKFEEKEEEETKLHEMTARKKLAMRSIRGDRKIPAEVCGVESAMCLHRERFV